MEVIHSKTMESWKERNAKALAALFGTRYPKRAEKSVKLRAPDMQGSDTGVPYAAYIHPSNPDAGAYGGMSFVIFPVEGERCLVGMVIGTQGLAPDEAVLGRPGHARKMRAICEWLNHSFGRGELIAWAKQDPTRIDVDMPEAVQHDWSAYERVFNRYGKVMYALYKPTDDRTGYGCRFGGDARRHVRGARRGSARGLPSGVAVDTVKLVLAPYARNKRRRNRRTTQAAPLRDSSRTARNGENENGSKNPS